MPERSKQVKYFSKQEQKFIISKRPRNFLFRYTDNKTTNGSTILKVKNVCNQTGPIGQFGPETTN